MERNDVESPKVAISIADAARRLSVSPVTVRRLLDRGALVRVEIGRSVRVLARSVDELAERGGWPVARALDTTTTPAPLALRPKDAAKALGISQRKLWELTRPRGSIPCVRAGGCVLYPCHLLQAWLAEHAGKGSEPVSAHDADGRVAHADAGATPT